MMKKFLLSSVLSVVVLGLSAQQLPCGTSFMDQLQDEARLRANIAFAERNALSENATMYIPVFFHLVAKTDGTGRPTMNDVFNAMCTMNADYAEHDIQFYLAPHPTLGLVDMTINNDNVYNNQSNTFLMNFKKHNNAVNYYVVGTAQTSNQQPGGAAAYYSPQRDWVVTNKTYTALGDNTLSHETGHFFSLRHTFFGWESDAEDWENQPPCFESADPGWPCAPSIYNGVPVEKANGSNCTTAADLICDTPPDYNFGYCAPNNCPPYNGGAQDPNCEPVNPMENNFMSYYFGCGDFDFTQGQIDVVKADRLSSGRNFLNNTFSPVATSITTPASLLVAPAEGAVLNDDDTAELSWEAVPGATYYYLEIDRTTTYASNLGQKHLVSGTSLTVTGLTANKKYFWRVRPFNEYYMCASPRQRSFTTGMVNTVEEIPALNNWYLSPNPVSGAELVVLQMELTTSLSVQLRVLDAMGREVYRDAALEVPAGSTQLQLPLSGLGNGLYFVQLESAGRVETKRLSVLR